MSINTTAIPLIGSWFTGRASAEDFLGPRTLPWLFGDVALWWVCQLSLWSAPSTEKPD